MGEGRAGQQGGTADVHRQVNRRDQCVGLRVDDEAGITGAAVMVLETILARAAIDAALAGSGRD